MGSVKQFLYRQFKLTEHHTDLTTEVVAGATTFLTMAYIILLVPTMLGSVGMDPGSVFLATCFTSALGCFLVGFIANYPVAVAPSMGLLAYFTFVVVRGLGFTWQEGLGLVLIAGALFLLLTLFQIRAWIIRAVPYSLSIAIGVGIGLFIGFVALRESGLIVSDVNTFVALGNMHSISVLLSLIGFCLIAALDHKGVPGAIIIGIFVVSLCGILLGDVHYAGVFSAPPSIAPTFLKFDIKGLQTHQGFITMFTFFLVALFDSAGTLLGVLQQAGLVNNIQRNRRLPNALLAESITATVGALLGTTTTSPYIESASGIRAGGRTGLTAIIVGLLFLLAIFLSPLALSIPAYATAPALLFVACLMIKGMMNIDWNDLTEGIPSAITIIMIPFTFSIANGIGFGFISYVLIKILSGKYRSVNPLLAILAVIFIAYFFVHNDVATSNVAAKVAKHLHQTQPTSELGAANRNFFA